MCRRILAEGLNWPLEPIVRSHLKLPPCPTESPTIMIRSLALTAFLALSMSSVCVGDIIVNITPVGATQTLFTFSGTTTATGGGNWGGNETIDVAGLVVSGVGILDSTLESVTGSVDNTSDADAASPFSSVSINNGNTDRIDLGLSPNLSTSNGDTLAATGSFIADIPISRFNLGPFTSTSGTNTGTVQFNVSAVPEPSSFAVLGIASLFSVRRKRA